MKKGKVEMQKGKIVADQHTMKHMPVSETKMNDYKNAVLKKSGQSLTLHTPK